MDRYVSTAKKKELEGTDRGGFSISKDQTKRDQDIRRFGELDDEEFEPSIQMFIAERGRNLQIKKKLYSVQEDFTEKEVNHHAKIEPEIIPSKSEASVVIRKKQFNCIFRTPFRGLGFRAPEQVSIGPFHGGENLPLNKYKYSILEKFLSRTKNQGKDLCFFVRHMITLEWRVRRCYSEDFSMTSSEFVEMMLVDACFIIEVLRHFGCRSEEFVDGSSFFLIEPWQIPILVRDLLLLENQIPFFILEELFDLSESEEGKSTVSLITMALKFFDIAFPLSLDFTSKFNHLDPEHLLDLILQTVRPSNPSTSSLFLFLRTFNLKAKVFLNSVHASIADVMIPRIPYYHFSLRSKPSTSENTAKHKKVHPLSLRARELRNFGIEFKPRRANSFTDIHFKDGVLEIPPVTINDLFISILINCVPLEYCCTATGCSYDFTAYAFFMSCLIMDPTDVECLRSYGIFSTFSNDSKWVASAFDYLQLSISDIDLDNIQDSYLYKTLMETERYHTGGAITRLRYKLRDPRILVFCITTLCFTHHIFYLLGSNVLIRLVNWAACHGPGYLPSFIAISICLLLGFYVIF